MQEIVFDDSNTPHFRMRGDMTEDKTLEEAAKKPMTILEDVPVVTTHVIKDDINSTETVQKQQTEDRLNTAQKKRILRSPRQPDEGHNDKMGSNEDLDAILRDSVGEAVLQ